MTLPDISACPVRCARRGEFVGKRSLLTPDATRPDRRQFIGLLPDDAGFVPAVGAHAIERRDGAPRSIGLDYHSATVRRWGVRSRLA